MDRVLILTADSGEELEVYSMLYRFREAGYAVDVAAPQPSGCSSQPDVAAAGGEFVEGPDVIDGKMVSATGWPDLAEWSKAFLDLLDRAAVVG